MAPAESGNFEAAVWIVNQRRRYTVVELVDEDFLCGASNEVTLGTLHQLRVLDG